MKLIKFIFIVSYVWFKSITVQIVDGLTLWHLKRKATEKWKLTNKQHFVIPVDNWKRGKWTIVNNESHAQYNRQAKKMGKPQIGYKQLLEIAVFKTPSGNYSN